MQWLIKIACLIVQDLENKSSYAMEPVNAAKLESLSSWINMGDLLLLQTLQSFMNPRTEKKMTR